MNPEWVMILRYTTTDASAQRELVEGLSALIDTWVRPYPGWLGTRFHGSEDGLGVVNTIFWATEADYRKFLEVADNTGRVAQLEALFERLGERVAFVEGQVPGHHVLKEAWA
ncbi:hypothetical protein Afil01_61590 [Actinorhabdospora filicis]|uniref:Antibiotic biosynthesis monooxygenase n=1 Tax=Actinorhabdospora filicis TaxID=1785913 RepID=A0A9W6W6B3_9ACTN|nr:hypothetical protein [Actinorhabdospora filicis]GLZ81352.1 hypothetical protein Afil01_61590 [Actinorhabdospora filicis]